MCSIRVSGFVRPLHMTRSTDVHQTSPRFTVSVCVVCSRQSLTCRWRSERGREGSSEHLRGRTEVGERGRETYSWNGWERERERFKKKRKQLGNIYLLYNGGNGERENEREVQVKSCHLSSGWFVSDLWLRAAAHSHRSNSEDRKMAGRKSVGSKERHEKHIKCWEIHRVRRAGCSLRLPA